MKILKPLFFLFLIANLIGCNNKKQEKTNAKILEINSLVDIFYDTNEIDYDTLKARLNHTSTEQFEKLKASVSKEKLDAKAIQLFNENFSAREIDALYPLYQNKDVDNQSSSPSTELSQSNLTATISPVLIAKREMVFKKLIEEGYKVYEKFRHDFYVLDSINYETLKKSKTKDSVVKKEPIRINGIYEVLSYERDATNAIDSIKIKATPSMKFDHLKVLKVVQENYGFNYAVSIEFDKSEAEKFNELTKKNKGRRIAIVVDDEILMAPRIKDAISGGKIVINGKMTFEKAKTIVEKILK